MIGLILLLFHEHVVAPIGRALHHSRHLISDLFPLELLAALHLLWCQQLLKIRQRDRQLAFWLWAADRELLVFDASRQPRPDALNVENVRAYAEDKHFCAITCKKRLLADLADVVFIFLSFPSFALLQLFHQPLLNFLRRLFLHPLHVLLSALLSLLVLLLNHLHDALLLQHQLVVLSLLVMLVIIARLATE